MREVISLNGGSTQTRAYIYTALDISSEQCTDFLTRIVGQAGCQIANSCWEVSNATYTGQPTNRGACVQNSVFEANTLFQLYCLEHGIQVRK